MFSLDPDRFLLLKTRDVVRRSHERHQQCVITVEPAATTGSHFCADTHLLAMLRIIGGNLRAVKFLASVDESHQRMQSREWSHGYALRQRWPGLKSFVDTRSSVAAVRQVT